jgi:ATP-dependent helicase YprA (DUF1998 family)
MSKTIQETIGQLHKSLSDYIEATYHIGNPHLITQRRQLLDRPGVIHQVPYLESTPRYKLGARFKDMKGIPPAALQMYETLAKESEGCPRLIYDPPYTHQWTSVNKFLVDDLNLVIMTGTGSGKTESFLLPILGKLAREAQERPVAFGSQDAMRALVLYPMNALVNDQLGRFRSLFSDPRLVSLFKGWSGRPPRFARYTSRTPYAGVRTVKKDSVKLKAFEEFYVEILHRSRGPESSERQEALNLLSQLKARGKWPAKVDIETWYGRKGTTWQRRGTEEFIRAVLADDDSELITRHEVQACVPDLLITNYSMLEYMLMRPIERPIFERTRAWLSANPTEKITIVLDEAHLYRGAAGAEVGLLLRRLRDRLDITEDRFQIICATASFTDREYAPKFGAQLSGVPTERFESVVGDFDFRSHASVGTVRDAEVLAGLDLEKFYASEGEERADSVQALLDYRGIARSPDLEKALYQALVEFAPLGLLTNNTMTDARPIADLGKALFPEADPPIANAAATNLMALGSIAREDAAGISLLPCRIHNFFRGLAGLWVCMDPNCSHVSESQRTNICGQMFSQPREQCECGARVLEFYTCRHCGTAYARAYTDRIDDPNALWSEPGRRLKMPGGDTSPLQALDILLEKPGNEELAEPVEYDLETGQLNPTVIGTRMRQLHIRSDRVEAPIDEDDEPGLAPKARGLFQPCAVCEETGRQGRSAVQDHQTKGDQPFQALVARQIQIQPPGPAKATQFAPLRGRKVLAFSDSRQVAARLAPNLQMYSVRDSLRPLIIRGLYSLSGFNYFKPRLNLEDLYLAVLLASKELRVRLRPELKGSETFAAEETVAAAVTNAALTNEDLLRDLWMDMRNERPPEALLDDIVKTVQDRFLGFEALAIGSLAERGNITETLHKLPDIAGIAEDPEAKCALTRSWLRCWNRYGFWLNVMQPHWYMRPSSSGTTVRSHTGSFKAMKKIIRDSAGSKIFEKQWLPILLSLFTEQMDGKKRRLMGKSLTVLLEGDWVRCATCTSVHRPIPGYGHCLDCGHSTVAHLDPMTDPVFNARKGYYRQTVLSVLLDPPVPPISLIAAEHTAQLNAPQNEDVFSKAEENELLFQDVELMPLSGTKRASAIDVLSSTTTMEVGIDIGALSGVALRNMPPSRANYQQRAGRAGRRGNAVATVIAFGSADSHDEHYFSNPDQMIRGPVVDPRLTLDNPVIVRRHIRAFLLQNYHQARLPIIVPDQAHDLFSVLGTVAAFRSKDGVLNLDDLSAWLSENEVSLQQRVEKWIPHELADADRLFLLDGMIQDCITAISNATRDVAIDDAKRADEVDDNAADVEVAEEEDDEHTGRRKRASKLLDCLLYKGILPRYAFPTDVATFHVFDKERSTHYRPIMRFAPSQGLPIALSQYAPGKQVWIAGKCYTSGAIYSPSSDDRFDNWQSRRLYLECSECGYAKTVPLNSGIELRSTTDCDACGGEQSVGPARYWMRPAGFAHPVDLPEVTSPDDMPETSYATRAKLTMETPSDEERWIRLNDRVRVLTDRTHLLVSNTGPDREGYSYCTLCGRIEASTVPHSSLFGAHLKPFPDEKEPNCLGNGTSRHVMLGTDFITDIALFSLQVAAPLKLKPGQSPTDVALRTVSEALAKAASKLLNIEPGELMAEYRPALTLAGVTGSEAEIFLYDTLPGGAGFSRDLAGKGMELFECALTLMKTCPENCESSCYRCLRSFKNKFEHGLLDRHVGASLLEYLMTGDVKDFDSKRMDVSTNLLYNDITRRNIPAVSFSLNSELNVSGAAGVFIPILATLDDGKRIAISLSGPLTTDFPATAGLQELRERDGGVELVLVNELLVRGNLPAATDHVLRGMGLA